MQHPDYNRKSDTSYARDQECITLRCARRMQRNGKEPQEEQDMSLVIGTISLAGKELTVAALKNYKPTSPLSVCLLERALPIQDSN